MALTVAEADRVLGADLLAGMCQAALAHGRNLNDLFRAAVAGELDYVNQRRLVIFISNDAVLQTLTGRHALVQRTQGKTHGQTNTLRNDRSLQEDAAAQRAFLAGNDLVRQFAHQVCVVGHFIDFVRHTCNFGEHLATDIRNGGVNTSHCDCSFFCSDFSKCLQNMMGRNTTAPVKILPKRPGFGKREGNKKQGK